jgi:hypothetical protein
MKCTLLAAFHCTSLVALNELYGIGLVAYVNTASYEDM